MKAEEKRKLIKELIKEFKEESEREQRRKVFHNTKLLMKNYNDLKFHVENAIDEISQINIEEFEADTDELYILSIKRSKIKTMIMIAHIEMSLDRLKNKQFELGCPEKYEALDYYYLQGKSFEEIQELLHCGKNTPSRWVNQMLSELSIFLFGLEALRTVG